MPYSDPEARREYQAAWARNNRKSINTKRRAHIRAGVEALKEGRPCMDCGNVFPSICYDFDHREGVDKRMDISKMMGGGFSLATIKDEISKCDLVCSNCHRIRTFIRRQYGNEHQLSLQVG